MFDQLCSSERYPNMEEREGQSQRDPRRMKRGMGGECTSEFEISKRSRQELEHYPVLSRTEVSLF